MSLVDEVLGDKPLVPGLAWQAIDVADPLDVTQDELPEPVTPVLTSGCMMLQTLHITPDGPLEVVVLS